MKNTFQLAILFVLFAVGTAKAQTYKFIATGFSVMEKNSSGEWGNWSDLQDTKLIISLDTDKNRFLIYSQEIQWYDILAYLKEEENAENIISPFSCKDEDGYAVNLSIITRKNQGNRKQLYITRKNFILVYNIEHYADKK
ncbi:MAG: hypothetical protein FGM16_02415 [Flavobacterium sp.]|nr:hypothetical protein [Flavobacterium sp.]